ncbi:hypothetical protein [Undibacterium sp. TC9W]|uniref:hypothetical protein n=1 Tax=Undibacterium sp. TC9W TaxID=3413053 RepID=UPI003BF1EEBE
MTANNEFRGNVGQVANGDASSVTSNGNVVTVNFNTPDEPREIETVNGIQRKNMFARAEELASLTNRQTVDIYNDFLRGYGIKKIKFLPVSKYKEVCEFLDIEIEKFSKKQKSDSKKTDEDMDVSNSKPSVSTTKKSIPETKKIPDSVLVSSQAVVHQIKAVPQPCIKCEQSQASLKKIKVTNRILALLLAVFVSSFAWAFFSDRTATEAKTVQNNTQVCEHSGDRFSIGSKVKNPDGSLMQCVLADGSSIWKEVEQPKKAVSRSPIKKPPQSEYE